VDDPEVRRPDITRAVNELGWKPEVSLEEGIRRTLPWFRRALEADPSRDR
jgi:dTDP-glucose 4,6-dehydratase